MMEIKGQVNTAVCLAKVIEDEAIEQIRRMCETLGFHVQTLKRVRIMNLRLGNLKTGTYRKVSKEEYEELCELLDGPAFEEEWEE